MIGAFATHAMDWHEAGCRVVPIRPRSKRPAIGNWTKAQRQGPMSVQRLIEKHSDANLGVVTGSASNLTIVDVDEPEHVEAARDRFGDTSFETSTPSGGRHLYYRHCGERNANRPVDGLKLDVRGEGGLAVAPPSVAATGAEYSFVEGSLAELASLPPIRPGALHRSVETALEANADVGRRNNGLHSFGLQQAHYCEAFDDLLDVLQTRNEVLLPPLPDAEVVRVASSVWRTTNEGRNWVGGEPVAPYRKSELSAWPWHEPSGSDAFALHASLMTEHGWRNSQPFILANAFSGRFGWGVKRFRAAKLLLEGLGRIECVHRGGRGQNDPPMFRLRKVRATHTNSNQTPPPPEGES